MIEREELEQMEVGALIDRFTARKIQKLIRILYAELASRQSPFSSELNLQKYDSECWCCSQNGSKSSPSCLKKVEMHLPDSKFLIEACHGYYRIYLIGKNKEKILIESGKRGSMYKFLSIIEKLNQN